MKKTKKKAHKWTPSNTKGANFIKPTGGSSMNKVSGYPSFIQKSARQAATASPAPAARSIGSRIGQGLKGAGEVTAGLAGVPGMARQGVSDIKGAFKKKKAMKGKPVKAMVACKTCGSKKHAASAHKTFHAKR